MILVPVGAIITNRVLNNLLLFGVTGAFDEQQRGAFFDMQQMRLLFVSTYRVNRMPDLRNINPMSVNQQVVERLMLHVVFGEIRAKCGDNCAVLQAHRGAITEPQAGQVPADGTAEMREHGRRVPVDDALTQYEYLGTWREP